MRIVPCTLLVICMLAGSGGCQLFGKKDSGASDAPFLGNKQNDKPKNESPADPLMGGAGGVTELNGLLAGRVIDPVGQPVDAQITVVCLDDAKAATLQDVSVNAQGYFMVQGLRNGNHYKLVTRARSGEKMLEVTTLTEVPNTRLLIQVNEKFAVPASPEKGKKSTANGTERPASSQFQIPVPGWQPNGNTPTPPPPPAVADKTRIAQKELAGKTPTVDVPGPRNPASAGAGSLSVPAGATPVPSCLKVGLRVENFALLDLNLRAWELKKERTGQLVLLDFWKTNCPPCLQGIATLRVLQDQYGSAGLQIVGIAYEDSGAQLEQSVKVSKVAQQRQANYQILLGSGPQCPLKRDLQVRGFPTLVLLDETGLIVWQHEGALERRDLEDLEFAIRRRLR